MPWSRLCVGFPEHEVSHQEEKASSIKFVINLGLWKYSLEGNPAVFLLHFNSSLLPCDRTIIKVRKNGDRSEPQTRWMETDSMGNRPCRSPRFQAEQENEEGGRDACCRPQTGNNPFSWFVWVLQEVSLPWPFNHIQGEEFKKAVRGHKISPPAPEAVSLSLHYPLSHQQE